MCSEHPLILFPGQDLGRMRLCLLDVSFILKGRGGVDYLLQYRRRLHVCVSTPCGGSIRGLKCLAQMRVLFRVQELYACGSWRFP